MSLLSISDFVIKRVLWLLTGTAAGCNQWVGELDYDRLGRAYVFLNKVPEVSCTSLLLMFTFSLVKQSYALHQPTLSQPTEVSRLHKSLYRPPRRLTTADKFRSRAGTVSFELHRRRSSSFPLKQTKGEQEDPENEYSPSDCNLCHWLHVRTSFEV